MTALAARRQRRRRRAGDASAAIAVCGPHLNGLGGDLLALVHHGGEVHALLAVGRAGSGADAEALRADGHTRDAPAPRHPHRSRCRGTSTGGWRFIERFATLPADVLLAPAIDLAEHGFPASPLLVGSLARVDDAARANLAELARQATGHGRAGPPSRHGRGTAGDRHRRAATGSTAGAFGDGLLQPRQRAGSPPTIWPIRWPSGSPRCAPTALGRRAVDHTAELAGLPGDRRRRARRRARPARRPRRRPLGAPADRGVHRRRVRPGRAAARRRRRSGTRARVRGPRRRWSTPSGRPPAGPRRRRAARPTCAPPTRRAPCR